ncbi:MAG: 30S ribosomal protein S18 [Alphaproteobacteria bacterium]|nr:30S ribosomal protein S18 [Alphaproteobacteria bacterium]
MSRPYDAPRTNDENQARVAQLVKRQFFKRKKSCPFSGKNAQKIDYKDVRMLSRYVSERGKIIPSRISSVSIKKQRELSQAIKRARFLALMPYVSK